MTRQLSAPHPPAPSASDAEPALGRPELARWLTRDLRVKGTPLGKSGGGASDPSKSGAQISGTARADKAAFARWLTSDLRPRQAASTPLLAPPGVPPEQALTIMPAAELEADDLAVLPVRRDALTRATRARRGFVLALLLLSAVGVVLFRRAGTAAPLQDAQGAVPPPPASVATSSAALPDPPLGAEPDTLVSPVPARRLAGADIASTTEPSDSHSRLGGPSKARFPDLPAPTLSRLARDGVQQARDHEALLRAAVKPPAPELAAQ
jgi:hypothetical protein